MILDKHDAEPPCLVFPVIAVLPVARDPQPHTGTLPWLALDLQFPADELGPFAHAALAHPGTLPGPNPCPSSETSASRSSPSNFRVTETLLAPSGAGRW